MNVKKTLSDLETYPHAVSSRYVAGLSPSKDSVKLWLEKLYFRKLFWDFVLCIHNLVSVVFCRYFVHIAYSPDILIRL